ncbi:Beta-1 adrenergic receptor [Dirofilaria immitis]
MIAYKDQCAFLEEPIRCLILSNLGSAPLKCLRYAFIAITIERFIAMCCYQRYEKWKYPIAFAFLPLTWIEIALNIKHIILTYSQNQNIYKSYCSSITINIVPLHLQTTMDTLSSRYQIRENMKTSKTMFIATIMYITSATLNLSGLSILTYFPPTDLLHFAILKEITSFSIAIFINSVSILFIVRLDYMRDNAIKWLLYMGCGPKNRVGEESMMNRPLSGRQHIEIIEQMWEKGVHRK